MHCRISLNTKLLIWAGAMVLLAGCTNGFLGLAPVGDRKEYVRARNLYNQQKYQQAIIELTGYIYKAGNVKRREARAYRLLGMSYEKLGRLDKALESYLEALEFHPKNVPLLLAAAGLYQRTGLTDRSQVLYERALKQEPDNLEALAAQAENYRSFGFYSKARAYYDRVFALDENPSPRYRARYASTFLNQGNYEQAFIHITQALALEHDNPDYWLLSSKAAFGLKNYPQALADIRTARQLAPQRTDLHLYLIIGLYQNGHYKDSLQEVNLLLKENPREPLGMFMKALNEWQLNHPYRARKHLAQAAALGENSFVGRVANKLLTEWKQGL